MRSFFKSEVAALYVGPAPAYSQHIFGDLNELSSIRALSKIQSISYGFDINREEIKQLGHEDLLVRTINLTQAQPNPGSNIDVNIEPVPVNFEFSYLPTCGLNEFFLNLNVIPVGGEPENSFISRHFGDKNFFLVLRSDIGKEGRFLEKHEDFLGHYVVGVGNAFLNNYSISTAVGTPLIANARYIASNIKLDEYSEENYIPAIDLKDGKYKEEHKYIFGIKQNQADYREKAILSSNINLTFQPLNIGGVDITKSNANATSFNIDINLSRRNLYGIGSMYPYDRRLDLPCRGNLNLNIIKKDLETGNLNQILFNDKNYKIQIDCMSECFSRDCSDPTEKSNLITYVVDNAVLKSKNTSLNVKDYATVDLNFDFTVTRQNGFLISGGCIAEEDAPGINDPEPPPGFRPGDPEPDPNNPPHLPPILPSTSCTPTPSLTVTPSRTQNWIPPTKTPTPTTTPSLTATPSVTATPSLTVTPSRTQNWVPPSQTPSQTTTPSLTTTPSITTTPSVTSTLTPTITPSATNTPSVTVTPSITATPSITSTPGATTTPSITVTPSTTVTPSISATPSITVTPSISATPSVTVTPSITNTPTITPTCIQKQLNVSFDDRSTYITEGGSGIVYVHRNEETVQNPFTGYFSVNYEIDSQPNSAESGIDFIGRTGVLEFLPGQDLAEIKLETIDDSLFENTEYFNITLSDLKPCRRLPGQLDFELCPPCIQSNIIGINPYKVLILDDDTVVYGEQFVRFQYHSTYLTEGLTANVDIFRDEELSDDTFYAPFSVGIKTVDVGSAKAGEDYIAFDKRITFQHNQLVERITLTGIPVPADNSSMEMAEFFDLLLYNPEGATIVGENPYSVFIIEPS